MARNEVRKECPSCGLGVPLDAKTCEFCGWNFDEEDEWITQIDKLEQELITEKQKFDDTSVDKMIKSTLRKPGEEGGLESADAAKPVRPVKNKAAAQKPMPAVTAGEPSAAGPAVSKPKAFRIDVAKIAAPKEVDKELEMEQPQAAPAQQPKEQPAPAPVKPAVAQPQAKKKPEVAPEAARPKEEKVVRRVITYGPPKPMMATGEARRAGPAKPAAPAATQQRPAPERPRQPAIAGRPSAAPHGEEKKEHHFGLGKMFGGGSHDKHHTPPTKEAIKPTVKVFICPLCNSEVRETEKRCPKCGAEFE